MISSMKSAEAGTRVRVRFTLLAADERAPNLPSDTSSTPYVVRVTGILQEPGSIGDRVRITTPIGRTLEGEMEEIEPGDRHSFGTPVPALVRTIEYVHRLRGTLR